MTDFWSWPYLSQMQMCRFGARVWQFRRKDATATMRIEFPPFKLVQVEPFNLLRAMNKNFSNISDIFEFLCRSGRHSWLNNSIIEDVQWTAPLGTTTYCNYCKPMPFSFLIRISANNIGYPSMIHQTSSEERINSIEVLLSQFKLFNAVITRPQTCRFDDP